MKHFIKSVLSIFLFSIIFFSGANAQDNRSKKLLKADLAFEAEQYFSADNSTARLTCFSDKSFPVIMKWT